MRTDSLQKELLPKERSIGHLIRSIMTRIEENPNYFLLLGAGCSVTSNIPSGASLVDRWRKEIFLEETGSPESEYNSDNAKGI